MVWKPGFPSAGGFWDPTPGVGGGWARSPRTGFGRSATAGLLLLAPPLGGWGDIRQRRIKQANGYHLSSLPTLLHEWYHREEKTDDQPCTP